MCIDCSADQLGFLYMSTDGKAMVCASGGAIKKRGREYNLGISRGYCGMRKFRMRVFEGGASGGALGESV